MEAGNSVSIQVSSVMGTQRRVVLSCDAPECPVQLEPPAAEPWRSDTDARSWARAQAVGWTVDRSGHDYCPAHAGYDATAPAPPATARNRSTRDAYATLLRSQLNGDTATPGDPRTLTSAQAAVAARLLDELAEAYHGESLGTLAHELSRVLDDHGDAGTRA
jgi:hypothetical protein